MRVSSRAIIIENGKILTMFRRVLRNGIIKEYNAIPGGGQESGETLEQNVTRELKEEMNIDIEILGYLGKTEDNERQEHYFAYAIKNGTPNLGGEELENQSSENYYEPMWVSLNNPKGISKTDLIFANKALNKEYI